MSPFIVSLTFQLLVMTVSRFAVGLLLIHFVNAGWVLPCAKPVLDARVDPILTPGNPSNYANSIMGSGGTTITPQ